MATISALGLAMLCVVLAVSPIMVRSNSRKEIILYTTLITGGPMANSVVVAGRPGPPPPDGTRFGDITVVDATLAESPDSNSPQVGNVKGVIVVSSLDGTRVFVSQTAIIERGKYKVGTLQIQGSLRKEGSAFNGEVGVQGGTGAYRFMVGYAEVQTVRQTPNTVVVMVKFSIKEIDD